MQIGNEYLKLYLRKIFISNKIFISIEYYVYRVTELSRWRDLFQNLLDKLVAEIKLLRDEKVDTEKEIETLNFPLQLTAECISMRDSRRGTELTYDEADTELKKELCVIENIKKLLTQR